VRKINYCCGVKKTLGFKWVWICRFGTKRENCMFLAVVAAEVGVVVAIVVAVA